SCAVLVDGAHDLRYIRAGEHFVVYVETNLTVTIIDILHSRCDLPRHIAALATL
ncbi:MAG: type II toxin-antitoxin system RelE/ParE family toxin, partial [Thalassococcus sp.]|nr:type II toxin-antitoxin system RelE/ParE family toxin [Thalassococcus sp.]